MKKSKATARYGAAVAVALAIATVTSKTEAKVLGPDAAACNSGSGLPAVLARVYGFKARTGELRVQAYGADPSEFLAKGKWIRRVDLPVSPAGHMDICLRVPMPGTYAIAVRHDVDGNGKSGWNDGGGFSRNPPLSLLKLKPRHKDVAIEVGSEPQSLVIVLNYRKGLSVGPMR